MSDPSTQVNALVRELHDSSAAAEKLFAGRAPEQLLRKPGEKSWSAAECLEHLNLSNRAYLPRLEAALANLRSGNLRAAKHFRMNWNAALLKYWLEPPSRLRMPASAPFQPLTVHDPAVSLRDFCALNSQLVGLLESSRGFALDQALLVSPFAKNMKYSAYSAFALITAHNRRHLWQAERTLARAA
jgi:DinB family protein